VARAGEESGRAFIRLAQIQRELKNDYESSQAYTEAAKAFRKSASHDQAVEILTRFVIPEQLEAGKHSQAGKVRLPRRCSGFAAPLDARVSSLGPRAPVAVSCCFCFCCCCLCVMLVPPTVPLLVLVPVVCATSSFPSRERDGCVYAS
jgi:hypothetical protein